MSTKFLLSLNGFRFSTAHFTTDGVSLSEALKINRQIAPDAVGSVGGATDAAGAAGGAGGEGGRADDESGAGAVGGLPSGGRSRGPMYLNSAMVG